MWLTHFWHSWSQFFIFAWDVTAGGILRTGVLICLVSNAFTWKKKNLYFDSNFDSNFKSVPEGPFNNMSVLVQVMAWCRPGDKPLSEAMLTQFTDAYTCMRHYMGGDELKLWHTLELIWILNLSKQYCTECSHCRKNINRKSVECNHWNLFGTLFNGCDMK